MNHDNTVYIYTDGSCNNKTHDKGGYGIVLKYKQHEKQVFGGSYFNSSSARMELRGAIEGLRLITNKQFKIKLYCDNMYVVKSICEGWAENWEKENWIGRKNKDLLQLLLYEVRKFPKGFVEFIHIKGHNNHRENEICDKLAANGAKMSNVIDDAAL